MGDKLLLDPRGRSKFCTAARTMVFEQSFSKGISRVCLVVLVEPPVLRHQEVSYDKAGMSPAKHFFLKHFQEPFVATVSQPVLSFEEKITLFPSSAESISKAVGDAAKKRW